MSAKVNVARTTRAAVMAGLAVVWALLSIIAPAEVAAAETTAPQQVSGSFFDLKIATLSSTLAVDAAGGEHMAVDRWNAGFGAQRSTYFSCPNAACVSPDQWAQVDLVPTVADFNGPSQLRLTPQGKPRILFAIGGRDGIPTSYRYAACDSACTTLGGWTVLDLGSVFNKPARLGLIYRDHSFALDPQGQPRFVYSFQAADGSARLHYAACDTGCATSVANWTKTTVSQGTGAAVDPTSVEYMALSLEFTAAGRPRVAGHTVELPRQGPTVSSTVYLECDNACSAPEPSPPPNPNWTVTRLAARQGNALMLSLDNNDAPHILVAGEEDLRSDLRWLRCTAGCTAPANWTNTLMGIAGSDPELVFGADNRPQVTFKGPVGGPDLGYGRCRSACDTAGPTWEFQEAGNAAAYEAQLPLPGSSCHPGRWLVGYIPSMALDPAGNFRVSSLGWHVFNTCTGNLSTNGIGVRLERFRTPATATGGRYTPLTPARILDTRDGTGGISAPVGPGASVDVQITGKGGVPATGVSAVAMNVTVTQPTQAGWLTLSPAGAPRPLAANLNFTPGLTVPNLVVVKVGAGGKLALFNSAGASHVVFDVAGWYSEVPAGNDGRFQSLVPARILDTRNGTGGGVRLGPGASLDVQVTGNGGVPASGAGAAVLNVAVTATTATSFLTVYPTGQTRPLAANLNYVGGDTVSNRVMAKLGTGGRLTIYNNSGSADVVVDVNGWYSDASATGTSGVFNSLVPARILDTRDGTGGISGARAAGSTVDVQITGQGGVPTAGVSAVILNATVTQTGGGGFLTIFPTGTAMPLASDLNYAAGETRPNLVVVKVGTGGKVGLFTAAGTHVVFDVAGWMS